MGNCAQFQKSDYIQLPGITSDFKNGFSAQAWIRPSDHRKNCRIFDFGRGKEKDNIFLSEDKKREDVVFAVYQGGKRGDKLVIKNAFLKNTWTHITVTVDNKGNAKGYLNGKAVASKKMKAPTAAAEGVRTRCYVGRSNWKDDKSFQGSMAELRVWTKVLTANEIAANFKTTLVGDEGGLLGYWPLSCFEERGPVDMGRSGLHGSATDSVSSLTTRDLPVKAGKAATVKTSRVIRMDYIPYSAFPRDRALCGVAQAENEAAQLKANVEASGTCAAPGDTKDPDGESSIVTCPVWEVTIEPGEGIAAFDLAFDRDVDLVSASAEGIRLTRQKGGLAVTWPVPADGMVRLRLPAGSQLELPCATLRTPDGGATRLDFPSIGKLTDVTSAELTSDREDAEAQDGKGSKSKSKSAGQKEGTVKPTALPGSTDPATADAVTLYIRQLACATPTAKFNKPKQSVKVKGSSGANTDPEGAITTQGWIDDAIGGGKKLIDDVGKGAGKVIDDVGDLAKGVGDSLEDVGKVLAKDLKKLQKQTKFAVKGTKALVFYTADAAGDLIKKAPKVTMASPVSLIEDSIRKSTKLCVSSVNAAANVVEMVGETLDKKVFKVIIQGVEAAVAAMRAFFERVGLFFRDLAAWLAWLLKWLDFRKPLDTIHDFILSQLDNMRDGLLASGDYVDEALARMADTFSNQTLAAARLGDFIPIQKKGPRSPELNFVLSHVEDALNSGISLGSAITFPPLPLLPVGPIQGIMGKLGALRLDRPFDLRCGDLIAPLAGIWEELVEAVRALLRAGIEAGAELFGWLKDFLTSRLKIPFFTSLFENVLFPGWKLTPLRLLSLWAAIPALLAGWGLSKLTDMKVVPASTKSKPESKSNATTTASFDTATAATAAAETASHDREQDTTTARSGKSSSEGDKGAELFMAIAQSIGLGVSLIENGRELYLNKNDKTGSPQVTGFLMGAGGAVGFTTAYCNWIMAMQYMKGRQRDLTMAGITFDLISSIVRCLSGTYLWNVKKNDTSAAEMLTGCSGVFLGLASTALSTAAAVEAKALGSVGREQECATAIWTLNAVTPFMDGVSLVSANSVPKSENVAMAASAGSLACSASSCGLAAYLYNKG